ncbi:MAG: hypothetical protein ACWGSQ_18795, partial [Longimicrobiales bacterium]
MRPLRGAALLLLLLLEAGCASAPGGEGRARSGQSSILQEELEGLPGFNVLQAVERLRPHWLRGRVTTVRGVSTVRLFPKVFVDGVPSGELERLSQMTVVEAREIRFFSASDATTRFGTGYPGGVIEVLT